MQDLRCPETVAFLIVSLAFVSLSPILTKSDTKSSFAMFAADETRGPTMEAYVVYNWNTVNRVADLVAIYQ